MIPGHVAEDLVGLGQQRVTVFGIGQGGFAGSDERLGAVGDAHDAGVTIGAQHIGDRRGHHRTATGEVFGGLGRADEAGRFVQRERHDRHVPARQVLRQLVVGLAAEVVDVVAARQLGRVDLDHRADQHDLPLRLHPRHLLDQLEIKTLVDHAVEAQARMGDFRLVVRVMLRPARGGEVLDIHAAGKRVGVVVALALGLVEAVAAGKDQVGAAHQLHFALDQLRWRAAKGREFVHAVVDDQVRCQMIGERQAHRRVVPEHQLADAELLQVAIEQLALHAGCILPLATGGQPWDQHLNAVLFRAHFQPGLGVLGRNGFFVEEHVVVAGEARHQVLRALVDEAPAQVREAQQRRDLVVEDHFGRRLLRVAGFTDVVLERAGPTHVAPHFGSRARAFLPTHHATSMPALPCVRRVIAPRPRAVRCPATRVVRR